MKIIKNRKARDLATALDIQREYDELNADCKDLFNVLINWGVEGQEITILEFNDRFGWPKAIYDYLMQNDIHKLIIQQHNETKGFKDEHEG